MYIYIKYTSGADYLGDAQVDDIIFGGHTFQPETSSTTLFRNAGATNSHDHSNFGAIGLIGGGTSNDL